MKMEYTVNVLRGWPNGQALDRAEKIKAATTLNCGDWVIKETDNTVKLSTSTATNRAGLVIRGNGDSDSGAYTNKATVLWGNFIAQIKNLPNGVTFTPGANLCIQNGKVQLATGGDPVIGHVLDVVAASSVNDAHIVAVFN